MSVVLSDVFSVYSLAADINEPNQGSLGAESLSLISNLVLCERVAQELNVYLAISPERTQHLARSLKLADVVPTAQKAVSRVEAKMNNASGLEFVGVDLSTPPVAELVLRRAQKLRIDVVEAVNTVRDSEHAVAFRARCRQVDDELRLGPRGATRSLQQLANDIDRTVQLWANDVDEGVRYVTRTISLRKLPVLGAFLESVGLAEISVRDPVIRPRDRSLLFLNDLYRAPA